MELLDECVAMLEGCQDTEHLALALYWRSTTAWDQCRYEAALSDAERGLALAQRGGHRHAEYMNFRALGQGLTMLGDHERAGAACERALSIAVILGADPFVQYALHSLAFSCTRAGKHDEAIELLLQRFELCQKLGDLRGQALSMGVLGDAYHGLGRYEDAVAAFERALPVFRDHFIRRHHALCLFKLGCAYGAMGDATQAERSLQESLPIFRELRLYAHEDQVRQVLRTGDWHSAG